MAMKYLELRDRESFKQKKMVQNRRRRRRRSEILTIKYHDIKVVNSFKYLGTAISNIKDETEEVKVRIPATNKGSSSLQTIFRAKQSTKIII
jgi:hypothetical protein